MPANQKLAARKKPTQRRSQQMVERILEATRQLLIKTAGAKTAKITTNSIAKEAGISVGSLYQYFPNTEAVLFEVNQEFIDHARKVIEKFDSAAYLKLPREEFFEKLIREVTQSEAEHEMVFAMRNAMGIYPVLADSDKEHAEYVAAELAKFFRHYGSKWPDEKLQRLGLYVFYLDYGTWSYRDHARPPLREVHRWEHQLFRNVISQCFD